MDALLDVVIPGDPVGKGRPRVTTVGGYARAYTPGKTASWEGKAASLMRDAWQGAPLDEPVRVEVLAISGRAKGLLPKSPTNKGGLSPRALERDPGLAGRLWRTSKPDGDNVLKAVGDALVNAGVICDDTRIVRWACDSLTAAMDEGPSVVVRLVRVGGRP